MPHSASTSHQAIGKTAINGDYAMSLSDSAAGEALDHSGDISNGGSSSGDDVEGPQDIVGIDSDVSWNAYQTTDSDESMSESEADVSWTSAGSCQLNTRTKMPDGLQSSSARSTQPKVKKKSVSTQRKSKKKGRVMECDDGIVKQKKCIECNRKHIVGECPFTHPVKIVLDSRFGTPVDSSISTSVNNTVGTSVNSPVGASASITINRSVETPIGASVDSPIGTSVDTPMDNLVGVSVDTLIDCIGDKSIGKFGDTPIATVSTAIDDGADYRSLAKYTLPNILKLSIIDEQHGFSVVAVENIIQYTQFGPLVGERTSEIDIQESMDLKNIWEIFGGNPRQYINTSNVYTSNWLRYMRPAPSKRDVNVTIVIKENKLYFITTEDVEAGTELIYWVEDPLWSYSKKTSKTTFCNACNRIFYHPLYYLLHCGIFHDPKCRGNLRKFRCKECGIPVIGRKSLRQHVTEMHNGKGAFQCPCCKQPFTRHNCMVSHLRYHCKMNPDRDRPLCELCGKVFSNSYKLNVHIRRMHSDDSDMLKEFQCQQCSKLMSSRTCLQRHMNEVHAMNEICTCDRCGKTFQNRSNLKIHMLTHSGVKPFRCTENDCMAAFTTKQCLQFHYKKIHSYTMDTMPTIERCIAYTFENYADGRMVDNESAQIS